MYLVLSSAPGSRPQAGSPVSGRRNHRHPELPGLTVPRSIAARSIRLRRHRMARRSMAPRRNLALRRNMAPRRRIVLSRMTLRLTVPRSTRVRPTRPPILLLAAMVPSGAQSPF